MDDLSKNKFKSGVSKEDILSTLDSFQTNLLGTPHGIENKENNNDPERAMSKPEQGGNSGCWEYLNLPLDTGPTPASLSHSYSLEWDNLFTRPEKMMAKLKEKSVAGDLRSSRFRSVVWKLFLEVLPPSMDKWVEKTQESRARFEELKNRLIVNPRKAVDSVNLKLHNPLSQDEESPWNKFFQDNELRLTIKQDVIRTFPEVEFFRNGDMVEMMLDILFCYSREHATHSYKQGMHELLAPIIFVLHCDHQAFLHACEIETVLDLMKEVMDPTYLEHDAYSMFCQVMETVEPWYLSRDYCSKTGSMRSLEIINATPFARCQDLNPSSAIVTKLTRIQDYVLKKLDPELHQHLERLEIAPQIYGIRWLRLLFGREFPMQDILMLWDAIFGDGIGFDLVDYIFVAMLLYIRKDLISSDYTTCLTILMKYPVVADVHYFVVMALHIREPSQYVKPPNYFHQGTIGMMSSNDSISAYDNVNMTGGSFNRSNNRKELVRGLPGHKRQGPTLGGFSSFSRKFSRPRTLSVHQDKNMPKSSSEPMNLQTDTGVSPDEVNYPLGSTVSLSQVEDSMMHHGPSASSLARMDVANTRSAQSSPGVHHTSQIFPLTPEDPLSETGSASKFNTLPNKWSKKKQKKMTAVERECQYQMIHLQGQLNDKETMCRYCASKLNVHIETLQEDLSRRKLDIGDELMVSLAGIKLVRDILNGTLKFSQTMGDDMEEFSINDSYYEREGVSKFDHSKGSEPLTPESDILMGASLANTTKTSGRIQDLSLSSSDVSPVDVPSNYGNMANVKTESADGRRGYYSDGNCHYSNPHDEPLDIQTEEMKRKMRNDQARTNSVPSSTKDTQPVQLTSKIRNIFKSAQKPQPPQPQPPPQKKSSFGKKSSAQTGSGQQIVEDYTDSYPKSTRSQNNIQQGSAQDTTYQEGQRTHNRESVTSHRSDGSPARQRSHSNVEASRHHTFSKSEEYPSSYHHPHHHHHHHHNRRGSRGSTGSNGSASDFVMVGGTDVERDGDRYGHRERSKSQPVNPLYSLKYDEGLDC